MKVENLEAKVECPITGCGKEVTARGLNMHVFHTNDPEGKGHYPKGETPPDFDPSAVEVIGEEEVEMDYPDHVDIEETEYLDTYTGKAYQGKRGLMIHLGQMAGQHNIPENVRDRHDADDFPLVETDENGNITEVIREPSGTVPPIKPYLPWYTDDKEGYIERRKVINLIEEVKDSPTQAISANALEEKLLDGG